MRSSIILALGAVLALGVCGCGQKGPLVRPSRSPTTPVVIRAPAPAAADEHKPDADTPPR